MSARKDAEELAHAAIKLRDNHRCAVVVLIRFPDGSTETTAVAHEERPQDLLNLSSLCEYQVDNLHRMYHEVTDPGEEFGKCAGVEDE